MPEEFTDIFKLFYCDIKVSIVNPQVVWTGSAMTSRNTLFVSTNGGVTFTPTNVYNEAALGVITGLATHPTDENTAYALFSFANAPKILRTTDLGQSWEDISGFGGGTVSTNGFPDVSVKCL